MEIACNMLEEKEEEYIMKKTCALALFGMLFCKNSVFSQQASQPIIVSDRSGTCSDQPMDINPPSRISVQRPRLPAKRLSGGKRNLS
jgi:hypothetical protein